VSATIIALASRAQGSPVAERRELSVAGAREVRNVQKSLAGSQASAEL
jgi:hypothetical protein